MIYLGQLRHPNLVKLIGYSCENDQRLLVYEYMSRGNLEKLLFRSKYMPTLEESRANLLFVCHLCFFLFPSFFAPELTFCLGMKCECRTLCSFAMVDKNQNCIGSCKGTCFSS